MIQLLYCLSTLENHRSTCYQNEQQSAGRRNTTLQEMNLSVADLRSTDSLTALLQQTDPSPASDSGASDYAPWVPLRN